MIWGIVAWQMTASQTEKRSEMSWEVGGGAQDRRWHTCGVLLLLIVLLHCVEVVLRFLSIRESTPLTNSTHHQDRIEAKVAINRDF